MLSDLSPSSGHGEFIILILPPIVAVFFIALYYISRIFIKKYNWIVSLFAIIRLLSFAIDLYIKENI